MIFSYQIGNPSVPLQPVWLIQVRFGRNCLVRYKFISRQRIVFITKRFALTVWRIL